MVVNRGVSNSSMTSLNIFVKIYELANPSKDYGFIYEIYNYMSYKSIS